MSAIELQNTVEELKSFLSQATNTRTKVILSNAIATVQNEISCLPKCVESKPTNEPVSQKRPVDKTITFQPFSTFSWSQDTNTVDIYFMDGLEGVEKLPKENILCNFTPKSVEIAVINLNGRNLRWVKNLYGETIPEKDRILVRRNRITIKLTKKHPENWANLEPEKSKFEPPKDSDPGAGLMDLMKNMYQNGDDNMKRTIAEAWTKAQSGEKPDMPNMN